MLNPAGINKNKSSAIPIMPNPFYLFPLKFNTSVNAPALVAEPALIELNEPAGTTIYRQYTLTNKGLISAFNVEITNSESDSGIKVETPFTSIPELKPGQSVVVPLKIYIVHTSCGHFMQYAIGLSTCARGIATSVGGKILDIINGGIEKACNTQQGAGGIAGGSQACVYIPQIAGPNVLLAQETTDYYISNPPEESKCELCGLECKDFVWTQSGDVQISGSNIGCSIKAASANGGAGSLTATLAGYVATKQINGCKVTDVTVKAVPLPPSTIPYTVTLVKGPSLKFKAETVPTGCPAEIVWTITPGVGTIAGSGENGELATFTPGAMALTGTITAQVRGSSLKASIPVKVFNFKGNLTPGDNFDGRNQDKYGIAEEVDLDVIIIPAGTTAAEVGGIMWEKDVNSPGEFIDRTDDGTALFNAGDVFKDTALELRLKIKSGPSQGIFKAYTKTIVKPSGAYMIQVPGTNVMHIPNTASVGFYGTTYLLPKEVSFANIRTREGYAEASAGGFLAPLRGKPHEISKDWAYIKDCNLTTGCHEMSEDTVEIKAGGGPYTGEGHDGGSFLWQIPWQYRVGTGEPVTYYTAYHSVTVTVTGRTCISKAGSGEFCKDAGEGESTYR